MILEQSFVMQGYNRFKTINFFFALIDHKKFPQLRLKGLCLLTQNSLKTTEGRKEEVHLWIISKLGKLHIIQ